MILHNISGSTFKSLTFYDFSNCKLIDIPFVAGNVTLDDCYKYHPVVKSLIAKNLLSITSYDGLSPDEEESVKGSDEPSAENVVITTSALGDVPGSDLTADEVAGIQGASNLSGTNVVATIADLPADELTADELAGIQGASNLSGTNVVATIADLPNNIFTENLGVICSTSLEAADGVHQLLESPSGIKATPTKISVCCVKADTNLIAGSRTLNLKIGSTLYPIVLAHTDGVVGVVKEATIAGGIEKADTANWIVETLVTSETGFTASCTSMWNFYVTYTKSL